MKVLSGVKLLEFAAIGPVPWCGMLLADMGASIVRIDRPGAARAPDNLGSVRRGRTAVEIDLKSDLGRRQALELVASADALIEGTRPGVMERLGLGPQECHQCNPRLVYGRMTGWGQTGPLALRAGHDINYIALTGALHAIGTAEHPVPPLNLVGDFGGGGAFLAMGVLGALLESRSTGQGRVVDAAMVDGSAALMAVAFNRMHLGQWRDQRASNGLDGGAPWYGCYATRDGRFMAVGAIEPQFYANFVRGLGLDEAALPDRADASNWPVLRQRFAEVFAARTRDEWAAHFEPHDACVSPVLSMTEAPDHPHLASRGTFTTIDGKRVPSVAPRFEGEAVETAGASRTVGFAEAMQLWR
ncbi:MAG: CoA transferase [Gammaproteobacteria bacterium]|nr:CoA transferase [Gammaproteobacteria bacterium]MBU1443163.1 CoA transferase [Gammaproteobacteria bacterium]MBU2285255.1 CoA transferase [Gammaproteobacteria bacterium]MBU2407233.1 CoA transferase [Gammaproteobacteria bacterium]